MDVLRRGSGVFVLWADVLWQQSLFLVPSNCCSADSVAVVCDIFEEFGCGLDVDSFGQKQVFRSQFCKFSEKNQGRGLQNPVVRAYNTCNTLHADVAFPTSFSIVRLAYFPILFLAVPCESAEDVRWELRTSIAEDVENTGKTEV